MSPGDEYETYLLRVFSLDTSETKIAAFYSTVADPVEGLRGPVPSLFLDETEARRFENNFFGVRLPPPPYLRVWMTVPPFPYLKVWIRQAFSFYDLSDKSRL